MPPGGAAGTFAVRSAGGASAGYARVSTAEQSADLQVDELVAAGCWRVWTDSASGVLDRRPQLDERGVGFRSLRENIDTTTAGGRLVFHLFGALAQFEREIIRDRTIAGLAAARARGRSGGRPSKLTAEQRRQARKMYDARELTVEQIGEVLGVSRTSIYRALADGRSTPELTVGEGAGGDAAGSPSPGASGAPRRRRRSS